MYPEEVVRIFPSYGITDLLSRINFQSSLLCCLLLIFLFPMAKLLDNNIGIKTNTLFIVSNNNNDAIVSLPIHSNCRKDFRQLIFYFAYGLTDFSF